MDCISATVMETDRDMIWWLQPFMQNQQIIRIFGYREHGREECGRHGPQALK